MPILVIAVVAFVIFNIMMVLFISAVISEQRHQRLEDRALATAANTMAAAPAGTSR